MPTRDETADLACYLKVLSAMVVGGLLLIASTTMAIDPFGVLTGSPRVYGFNRLKIERMAHDRLAKPYDRAALTADVIVFGTSRVKRGMDPKAWNGTLYNAGIDAASIGEIKDLLAFYLWRGAKPSMVIVETMVFQFSSGSPFIDQKQLGRGLPLHASWPQFLSDWATMTLSYNAMKLSYSTVMHNISQEYAYTTNALGYAPGFPGHSGKDFAGKNWGTYVAGFYGSLLVDDDAMSDLAAIAALCAARGIDLRLFAAPMHPVSLVPVWEQGGREFYAKLLQRAGDIAPLYSYMLNEQSWEKRLSDPKPGWSDSSHFSPEVGGVMLRDMTAQTPRGGTLIDGNSLSGHMSALEFRTHAWQRDNPDFRF